MRRAYCGALVILGIAVPLGALAREVERTRQMVYSQPGTEAGLGLVIETFLDVAAGFAEDPEVFEPWCENYRIDPAWPSAHRLGSVFAEVSAEYGSRLNEARETAAFTTADGLDPNDWKNEAIGRAFGEIYEELRLDGYDMELKPLP